MLQRGKQAEYAMAAGPSFEASLHLGGPSFRAFSERVGFRAAKDIRCAMMSGRISRVGKESQKS